MLKIAVFTTSPSAIRLHEALRFLQLLNDHAEPDELHVVLGVPRDTPAERWCQNHPLPLWKELRSFSWQEMDWKSLTQTFGIIAEYGHYVRPLDGGLDFRDCDFWLFTGGIPQIALPPLVPFGLHLAELPDVVRSQSPQLGGALLKNVRSADLLLFPTGDYLQYWKDMALVHDRNSCFSGAACGECKLTESTNEANFSLSRKEYVVYISGGFLSASAISENKSLGMGDEIYIIPVRKESITLEDMDLVPSDWSMVESIVAKSSLVISEPILDPCDIRFRAFRKLGKKPLMPWRRKWHRPPEWLEKEVMFHFDDDPLPLERCVEILMRERRGISKKDDGLDPLPTLNGRLLIENIREVVGK